MNARNRADLRVAIVVTELRPGGMERLVVHLANGICRRGVAVMVICLAGKGLLARDLDRPGVRLEALQSHTGWDIGALLRLAWRLRQFGPTVLHIHDYASLPYIAVANFLAGVAPILFTGHGLLYEGFGRLRSRNRLFSRSIHRFSAVSEEVARRHRDYLNWQGPVSIIRNGVAFMKRDDALRHRTRAEFGCEDGAFLFLAVGNPRPEKGFEDLLAAARLLGADAGVGRRYQIAIAGALSDSNYCRKLKSMVQDYGLAGRCRFLGYRSDTEALYAAADAFVLSSRSEGLPMVILEAMTIGLPVVATRVGGVPDALADGGLLVPPASPVALADAMSRMCRDRELAARLGSAARKKALDRFGVDAMVDAYLGCYADMAASKNCR